jgi:hypothetical protein
VNPNYKGESVAWRHAPRDSHTSYRPEEEWVRLPDGVTPAIVSPALWSEAQERLRTNRGESTRNENTPFLLRGHITCPHCGLRMFADTVSAKVAGGQKKRYRYYRCASRVRDLFCASVLVPADAIEARVWERLSAAIHDPTLIYAQWEKARESGPDPSLTADRDATTRTLERLTRQQERLVRRLREAEDDLADLIEREIAVVERERKELRATLAGIEARLNQRAEMAGQLGALVDYCQRVGLHLADFDFDRKRLALAAFNVQVEASGPEHIGPWRLRGSVPLGCAGDSFGVMHPSPAPPAPRSAPRRPH